jgi:SAM-dependent methyltransferase
MDREFVASAFLRGHGIEIGALHMPLRVPPSARVTYVDRFPLDDLRKHYPELSDQALVAVDVVADGERLEPLGDESQDFVIANHFLEHCQDPIGAVLNMFRVLKPGGILYLGIPDKRYSFDVDRPLTTLEHLLRDYTEGPAWSRLVSKVRDEEASRRHTAQNMEMDYSIHYHVWTQAEMLELTLALRKLVAFEVELCLRHESEVIFILRKSAAAPPPRDGFGAMLDRTLTPEPWCIDRIALDGEALEIVGWALAPGGRHADVGFTVNGRPFEEVEYPIARADLARVFWFKPGADAAAFRCRTAIDQATLFAAGYATLQCVDVHTGAPLRTEYTWYYPDPARGAPLPDPARRRRVAGNDDAEIFRLEGHTTFRKLDLALRAVTPHGLDGFGEVLDWGCGCGRLARYFATLPGVRLTGLDIDRDNLNWCRDHLRFASFRLAPLSPPTELPSAVFDLIIGISVFSHLTERDQVPWLHELHRLVRPGGHLLLSVLGEATACQSPWDASFWERWRRAGIVSMSGSDELKDHIADGAYYGNTYMTPAYVRERWSRVFTVVDIIPAYIGNHQDLVILRRPD